MSLPLVITIDGMNAAHRMRHAFRGLSTKKTKTPHPTGVLFGFIQMIAKLIQNFTPDAILVMGDSGTWRKAVYPEYKANRHKDWGKAEVKEYSQFMDVEVVDVQTFLSGVGIPYYEVKGYEADDLAAVWVKQIAATNVRHLLISTDKDWLQLVQNSPECRVYNPITEAITYADSVGRLRQSNRAPPLSLAPSAQVFLWQKALVGDPSDNIKGVSGIGAKTAARVFNRPEDSGETFMAYYRDTVSKMQIGKRQQTLDSSHGVVLRNMILMDLIGGYASPWLDKCAKELEQQLLDSWPTKQATGKWIDSPTTMDPSPFLNFFRAREFQFAHVPSQWRQAITMYKQLYRRHCEMILGGIVKEL